MRQTLENTARYLAAEGGGFTLWLGAGASIALTKGATPSWTSLIRDVAGSYRVQASTTSSNFPTDLETLSQAISHAAFRRELRLRLVDPVLSGHCVDTAAYQAVVGSRASTLVSFNLEFFSAFPFVSMKCGSQFIARTFRERGPYALEITPNVGGGVVSAPVYFPHGLLDYGSIVMTQSEYDRHQGSLAVGTAVHLAIGGDLVILGMSLGDVYLRDAILQNRRWLRNVYWIDEQFQHQEWARVANVTLVECSHQTVWKTLADAVLANADDAKLSDWLPTFREQLPAEYEKMRAWTLRCKETMLEFGAKLVGASETTPEHLTLFAQHCLDVGYELPQEVSSDSRCNV